MTDLSERQLIEKIAQCTAFLDYPLTQSEIDDTLEERERLQEDLDWLRAIHAKPSWAN
jgi:hypothetical protein